MCGFPWLARGGCGRSVHGGAHDGAGDHGHGAVDASHVADHTIEGTHEGVAHAANAIEAGFAMPGLIEIGTMIGFLSLFLFVFYNSLSKANLIAKNDPYLSESLHHHV